jgi:hypothetical protein
MSQDPKDPKKAPAIRVLPPPPDPNNTKNWREWYVAVRVAVDDQNAVLEDRLRRPRKRDLGVREAKRLYREARDKLAALFAYADGGCDGGGGGDDESGRDPAGSGGSPAH